MTDAPERIWLQDDGEWSDDAYVAGEITWCDHAINEADTRYIRADIAEAEKRAARSAAYEKAATRCFKLSEIYSADGRHKLAETAHTCAEAIRALADTDALAEYVERERAEERERCLNLVPDGSDEWYENLRPVHVKRMLAVLRAAIRQETNDAD
jgi:hypothetical protein